MISEINMVILIKEEMLNLTEFFWSRQEMEGQVNLCAYCVICAYMCLNLHYLPKINYSNASLQHPRYSK